MTIHDEILWALTQVDNKGMIPIQKMIESDSFDYNIEYANSFWDRSRALLIQMVPDIIVSTNPPNPHYLIIEVENDIKWDFSDSLRQIKKYQQYMRFEDNENRFFIAIIPEAYDRFTPMYRNEGIDVWTWEASRIWQCRKCDKLWIEKRAFQPRCPDENCKDKNVRLYGVVDFKLREKQPEFRIISRTDDNLKREIEEQ